MWNCNHGNNLSRNIRLNLVGSCVALGCYYVVDNHGLKMAQIAPNLEQKHTGRKRPTIALWLGLLIESFWYNCLLRSFIRISMQILIVSTFLSFKLRSGPHVLLHVNFFMFLPNKNVLA